MSLMTVGIGKHKGQTFAELILDIQKKRDTYRIPANANIVRTPVGSTYLMEAIWVEEDKNA